MTTRGKFLLMGTIVCGAMSLSTVACTQLMANNNKTYIDMDTLELVQLEEPQEGDTVATIKTSLGDIKAVLYPEYAPKAVENFTELAESGYYDGTYVYQTQSGGFFAGSPEKDGGLGDKADESHEKVEKELHQNLWPFKGALYSISTGSEKNIWKIITHNAKSFNGSRFAVLNTVEFTDEFKEELLKSDENTTIADAFIKTGGVPNLSQQVSIFGQTYEGFDVIEEITSSDTENSSDNTDEDIIIETVEIGKYTAE